MLCVSSVYSLKKEFDQTGFSSVNKTDVHVHLVSFSCCNSWPPFSISAAHITSNVLHLLMEHGNGIHCFLTHFFPAAPVAIVTSSHLPPSHVSYDKFWPSPPVLLGSASSSWFWSHPHTCILASIYRSNDIWRKREKTNYNNGTVRQLLTGK